MKIHKVIVEQIIQALDEIFVDNRYADKVIEKYLKQNRKWGSRDRKYFAENVYEIVRWRRFLEFIVGENDPWALWFAHQVRYAHDLPDWPEISDLDPEIIRMRMKSEMPPAIKESFPDWMYELGKKELGQDWDKIANALNMPAQVYLRTNLLKTNPADLVKKLMTENIPAELLGEDLPLAIKLKERKNVFVTKAFQDGLFEVQDAASQMIAPMLKVEPGMRVVDACAGAGGKSLHLSCFMKNKGKIIALDIHEWKLDELKKRARRNGVDIIETKVIDSTKVVKRLENSADRLLLDVPCSGMGVLRRNPDSKWKLTIEEIERLEMLQHELLMTYSQMLKPGGIMVYATCSLLPRENQKQIEKFLAEQKKEWKILEEKVLLPHQQGFDGFYACSLQLVKG